MKRDFRGYSLVQYSTFLGFLVCSDPKPSHLITLFLHFLGPRRQDTDFVFVLHSVRTSASCPSKRLLSASKTVKTCRSTWPFLNFLFLFDWTERISRGTHSELPLMKWSLNVFLKYLTPSVALRDSLLSSPLYISASPTSRLFSAGPRFVSSNTVRSNQSSINSSYLNQDVDPLKKKRLAFVLWFHSLLYIIMSTLRDMLQSMILLIFCTLMGSHQNLPHNPLGLLKSSSNTHSRGILFTIRSSTFTRYNWH